MNGRNTPPEQWKIPQKTQVWHNYKLATKSREVGRKQEEFFIADIPGQVENIIPVEDKTEEDHLQKKKEKDVH